MTIAGTRRSLRLLVYNARFPDPNQTWALRGALEKLSLMRTGSPVHSLVLSKRLGTDRASNYPGSLGSKLSAEVYITLSFVSRVIGVVNLLTSTCHDLPLLDF